MRAFLSGVCCVVVGLEVLIGVPLAVCLAFFAVTQSGTGVVAYESHSTGPVPSTITPPNYSAPQPYFPPPTIISPPGGPLIVPAEVTQLPNIESTPTANTDAATSPNAEFAAIVKEARERNGSPLDGTLLDSPPSSATAPVEPMPSLRPIAADSAVVTEPMAAAASCPATSAPPAATCVEDLVSDLQKSVQQLYAVAARFENRGNFGRADQVRELARGIREELAIIRRDESLRQEPLVTQPAPRDVDPPPTASQPLGTAY